MTQLLLDLESVPKPTFDNFVIGANAEAIAAIRRFCSGAVTDGTMRFVYLWGQGGSGRSHVLRAVCSEFDGRYLDASDATAATIRAAADHAGPLAIDDVERLEAEAQEALFHAINVRRETPATATFVAGNAMPRDLVLDGEREDLRSRLAWGLVYRLEQLDDDEKDAALVRHATQRGFPLSLEVRRYLLTHCSRDLGVLMQIVDTLDKHGREHQRILTVPLVREFMQHELPLHRSTASEAA